MSNSSASSASSAFVPPSPSSKSVDHDKSDEPPRLTSSPVFHQSPQYAPPWSIYNPWNLPTPPWTPWSPSSGTSSPWSPYTPPPPPKPALSIHRHLCYNTSSPTTAPELQWDIVMPHDTARVHSPCQFVYWEKPDLGADAIQPPVKKLWIDCDHESLSFWFQKWGPITLSGEKITVGQVLEAIYKYLRTPLAEEDLRDLNSIPGNSEALESARARRANDSAELDEVVLASSFQRVDVAGFHRRFQGLRIVIKPDKTWKLHFNLLPGTVPQQY